MHEIIGINIVHQSLAPKKDPNQKKQTS
jgi:hypothetical protein